MYTLCSVCGVLMLSLMCVLWCGYLCCVYNRKVVVSCCVFFSSIRRLTRASTVSWARRCVKETASRPLGAADRSHRRRQDAGRFPADSGGTIGYDFAKERRGQQGAHLHRPRRQTHRRSPHALHLAVEGARGRPVTYTHLTLTTISPV